MNIISERTNSRLAQGSHVKIVLCKVVVKVVDTKFRPGGFSVQRNSEERLEKHLLRIGSQIEFGTSLCTVITLTACGLANFLQVN